MDKGIRGLLIVLDKKSTRVEIVGTRNLARCETKQYNEKQLLWLLMEERKLKKGKERRESSGIYPLFVYPWQARLLSKVWYGGSRYALAKNGNSLVILPRGEGTSLVLSVGWMCTLRLAMVELFSGHVRCSPFSPTKLLDQLK